MSTDVGRCAVCDERFSSIQIIYISAFYWNKCGISSDTSSYDGNYYLFYCVDRLEDSHVDAPNSRNNSRYPKYITFSKKNLINMQRLFMQTYCSVTELGQMCLYHAIHIYHCRDPML